MVGRGEGGRREGEGGRGIDMEEGGGRGTKEEEE